MNSEKYKPIKLWTDIITDILREYHYLNPDGSIDGTTSYTDIYKYILLTIDHVYEQAMSIYSNESNKKFISPEGKVGVEIGDGEFYTPANYLEWYIDEEFENELCQRYADKCITMVDFIISDTNRNSQELFSMKEFQYLFNLITAHPLEMHLYQSCSSTHNNRSPGLKSLVNLLSMRVKIVAKIFYLLFPYDTKIDLSLLCSYNLDLIMDWFEASKKIIQPDEEELERLTREEMAKAEQIREEQIRRMKIKERELAKANLLLSRKLEQCTVQPTD